MESLKSKLGQIFTRARLFKLAKFMVIAAALIHVYALLLRFIPVPGTILMVQRAVQGEDVRRDWTRLEDISPFLPYAVIGAEDARFCQHHGIDLKAVEKVLEERERTGRKRGGSTITQQTAKNVFLWNGGGWIRKLPETWMSLFIDASWSKRRIMEVYLNVAEWGDGIFGAEAAAQARFGKSAKDLTLREASLLAAVLPSPHKWRLDPPGEYVAGRAAKLRARAADVSYGKYGNCLKLDDSKLRFPAAQKPTVKDEDKKGEPEKPENPKAAEKSDSNTAKSKPANVQDDPEKPETPEKQDKSPDTDSLDSLLDNIEEQLGETGENSDDPQNTEDEGDAGIAVRPLDDETAADNTDGLEPENTAPEE